MLNYLGDTRWATMAINCDWISKNGTLRADEETRSENIRRVSKRREVDKEGEEEGAKKTGSSRTNRVDGQRMCSVCVCVCV